MNMAIRLAIASGLFCLYFIQYFSRFSAPNQPC